MKLLKIDWLDSYSSTDNTKSERFIQESVGWYAGEDKDYIRLAQNLGEGEVGVPYTHILKRNITSSTILTETSSSTPLKTPKRKS